MTFWLTGSGIIASIAAENTFSFSAIRENASRGTESKSAAEPTADEMFAADLLRVRNGHTQRTVGVDPHSSLFLTSVDSDPVMDTCKQPSTRMKNDSIESPIRTK
jgi:hypothetical protein